MLHDLKGLMMNLITNKTFIELLTIVISFSKVQELGLQVAYTSNNAVYQYIKKLMAMPFLPHHEIQPMFVRLRLQAQTQPLLELVDFVVQQWIESSVFLPKDWCIYRQPICTNSNIEGLHHALNRWAGGHCGLPLYSLIELLDRGKTDHQYNQARVNPNLKFYIQSYFGFCSIFLDRARPREWSLYRVFPPSWEDAIMEHNKIQVVAQMLENASTILRKSASTANAPMLQASVSNIQVSRSDIGQDSTSISNSSAHVQRSLNHARNMIRNSSTSGTYRRLSRSERLRTTSPFNNRVKTQEKTSQQEEEGTRICSTKVLWWFEWRSLRRAYLKMGLSHCQW